MKEQKEFKMSLELKLKTLQQQEISLKLDISNIIKREGILHPNTIKKVAGIQQELKKIKKEKKDVKKQLATL
ncbi:hypothetical protein [Risungbinella massiliensis]|uniref:hypothetical protein n=1 Tax=Risungbinella massiliensis TaxID=1329796 RepID=UPI0005CBED8E|nr:hypothetical protein [Risungbinella massiliensis]